MTHQPKRHPDNSNLPLHYESAFGGLPVLTRHAPFITEYLEGINETTQLALRAQQLFHVPWSLSRMAGG